MASPSWLVYHLQLKCQLEDWHTQAHTDSSRGTLSTAITKKLLVAHKGPGPKSSIFFTQNDTEAQKAQVRWKLKVVLGFFVPCWHTVLGTVHAVGTAWGREIHCFGFLHKTAVEIHPCPYQHLDLLGKSTGETRIPGCLFPTQVTALTGTR